MDDWMVVNHGRRSTPMSNIQLGLIESKSNKQRIDERLAIFCAMIYRNNCDCYCRREYCVAINVGDLPH